MNPQSQQSQSNSISAIADSIMSGKVDLRISREEYEAFKREYIIDALAGKRYGQAFCERFIGPEFQRASTLYYFNDMKVCERWIEDNYLDSRDVQSKVC